MTIRGVVAQALASARVLVLSPPVSGVTNVALTEATEVVRAGGAAAAVSEITAGSSVEVTGRRTTADTVVARRVVLL